MFDRLRVADNIMVQVVGCGRADIAEAVGS
jgi:hypothetical protein